MKHEALSLKTRLFVVAINMARGSYYYFILLWQVVPSSDSACTSFHVVVTVSLECDSAEVSEGVGQLQVCAVLTEGDLAINVTVSLSTVCSEACSKLKHALYMGIITYCTFTSMYR